MTPLLAPAPRHLPPPPLVIVDLRRRLERTNAGKSALVMLLDEPTTRLPSARCHEVRQ